MSSEEAILLAEEEIIALAIVALVAGKKRKKRRRNRKKLRIKPWLLRRTKYGQYERLLLQGRFYIEFYIEAGANVLRLQGRRFSGAF